MHGIELAALTVIFILLTLHALYNYAACGDYFHYYYDCAKISFRAGYVIYYLGIQLTKPFIINLQTLI